MTATNPSSYKIRVLIIFLILGAAYYLNSQGILRNFLTGLENLGPRAPLIFVGLSMLASIFFVPSLIFTFSAGVLFGLSRGIVFSLAGAGAGSAGAFLIGRYLARGWILKKFSHSRKFEILEKMVRQKGWRIVALARLSPVFPFMVGNYLFGLTPISAKSYFGASLLGSLPSTSVYVYLGTLSRDLALLGRETRVRTPAEWFLFLGGLLATVLLALYFKRLAQNAMGGPLPRE